jgi:hypothetical protein
MADRVHTWVIIGFMTVAALGFTGWKRLRSGSPAAASAGGGAIAPKVPNLQLAPLMNYAAPLNDSLMASGQFSEHAAELSWGTDVVRRDPFSIAAAAVPVVRERVVASRAAKSHREANVEWRVSATLLAGDKRAAVINDELVYVGERVAGGATLTQVERDHVLVIDGKGTPHLVPVKEGDT